MKAGISNQSLYQIVELKTDSKTGKPKGVGPSIRLRLDRHYPGWLATGEGEMLGVTPISTTPAASPAPGTAAGVVGGTVGQLGQALASHNETRRQTLAGLLARYALDPTNAELEAELEQLLTQHAG